MKSIEGSSSADWDTSKILESASELLLQTQPSSNPEKWPLLEKLGSTKDSIVNSVVSAICSLPLLAAQILMAPAEYAYTLQRQGFRENSDEIRTQAVLTPILVAIHSCSNGASLTNTASSVILTLSVQGAVAMILDHYYQNGS